MQQKKIKSGRIRLKAVTKNGTYAKNEHDICIKC